MYNEIIWQDKSFEFCTGYKVHLGVEIWEADLVPPFVTLVNHLFRSSLPLGDVLHHLGSQNMYEGLNAQNV